MLNIFEVSHKIWHFREFWGIEGTEAEDFEIAKDIMDRHKRTNLQIDEYCKQVFHKTWQDHIIDDVIEIGEEEV